MKCPKCQFENPETQRFCGECGTQIIPAEEISAPPTETLETPKEELTTGSTFAGRYQIIEELGKGGMGKVYKTLDKEIKGKVALKLIKPEVAADKRTIERFRNELKMARDIAHKNVCRMYDLNKEEGTYYITMEYVSGEDLKSFIRRAGPLSAGKTIFIAKQVCDGLIEAHRLGVVHRDLKPQNIMIDREGNARIMDFGIARSLKEKGITGAGVMIGTPEYMSPEQVEAKEVDQRSDIYSLGVILYEMVTGRVPFEGETPLSIAVKHKTETPLNPQEINSQIPEALSRVILKCIEKDKQNRYQSAEEVRSELNKLEKGIPSAERIVPERRPTTAKEITVTLRKSRVWIVSLFAVVLVAVLAFLYFKKGKDISPPKNEVLVVLPFENLGPPQDEYFADGITDEITSRLSALHELDVISRASAVQYKNTDKTIMQIKKELNVDYVLAGTVRWDRSPGEKGRVRITPQLILAADGTQLWSESYDRVIDDIFSVQSDMAEQVTRQLDVTLLKPEQQTLKAKPTENLDAYHAYLRGMAYLKRPSYLEEDYRLAVQMFEQAVELDPSFALAYAELSQAYSLLFHHGFDRSEERYLKAKAAADQALSLQPELPEGRVALGYYYYYCHKKYDQALKEFDIAGKKLPNETEILKGIAYIQRRLGKFEKAAVIMERAFELSPQDAKLALNLGQTYMALRRYPEAERYYDRSISIAPDDVFAYQIKALYYRLRNGDLEKARVSLEAMPKRDDPLLFFPWFEQELLERNYQAALARLSSAPFESIKSQDAFIPKAQLAGFVYQLMNKPELARSSFDSARILLETEIKKYPDDHRIHSSLGIVYAALGRKQDAIREGKLAIELYPISKDALIGTTFVGNLAWIYVMTGEYDAAIEQIEYLLSIPCFISVPMLELDSAWDPLREHPRFKRLLQNYKEDDS